MLRGNMTPGDKKLADRIRAVGKSLCENADRIACGTPWYTTKVDFTVHLDFEEKDDRIHVEYDFIPEECPGLFSVEDKKQEVKMSEYGPGLTMKQCFKYDRERIQHALDGELVSDETAEGFVYSAAPEEACREYILGAFDNACYHAMEQMASGRAMEKVLKKHMGDDEGEIFREYMRARGEDMRDHPDWYFDE